jgi:hypothetical protein
MAFQLFYYVSTWVISKFIYGHKEITVGSIWCFFAAFAPVYESFDEFGGSKVGNATKVEK